MSELRRYHHVSLSVTDVDKSSEWYRQVFGLELDAEIEADGFRRTRLRAKGSDGLTLTLTAHRAEAPEAFSERRPGLDHIAFEVSGEQELSALKQRFEQFGVDHSDIKKAMNGAAMITLRDPDNIQLEVFCGPVAPTIAAGG